MTPYYERGGVVIYHEDCREVLPGLKADVLFADPPYGVDFAYSGHHDERGAAYERLLSDVQPLIENVAETRLITPGIANIWRWPAARWVLCWYKPGSSRRSDLQQPDRPQGGFNEWEPVLVYGRPRFMHDAIRLPARPQADIGGHPCPKPLPLLRWLINNATTLGDIVVDPFMGSGTTLRAAMDLGRRAIGIEVEERYCEIAAKRLQQDVLPLEVPA